MKKNALYLLSGLMVAIMLFLYFMVRRDGSSGNSGSESNVRDTVLPPAEEAIGKDSAGRSQKELQKEAKHEMEYRTWMKASGRENEGRTPFSFDTHGIAGGLQQYFELFQKYPEGGNREIAKALFGDNPRKLRILNWPQRKLGVNGEFLDPWGTPYRIEAARDKIEIVSAGPNRLLGDADDQIAK